MPGNPALTALRRACPDCKLVAYIDLQSNMVLSVDADQTPVQETLDDLAEATRETLRSKLVQTTANRLGE